MSKIEPKNLLLLFEGSQSEFEQIQALFTAGQLSKLLDATVLDLGIVAESQLSAELATASGVRPGIAHLSRWFEHLFESGWLSLEQIPLPAYRSGVRPKVTDPALTEGSISRAKVIKLGEQILGQAIALAVLPILRADGLVDIYLRCYPVGDFILPPGLQMLLLDDKGVTRLKSQAKSADIRLQMDLEGQLGGCFSVQLQLGDCQITENFVI